MRSQAANSVYRNDRLQFGLDNMVLPGDPEHARITATINEMVALQETLEKRAGESRVQKGHDTPCPQFLAIPEGTLYRREAIFCVTIRPCNTADVVKQPLEQQSILRGFGLHRNGVRASVFA
jgi:hypothetical protein